MIDAFRFGGGENVAKVYSFALSKLGVHSTVVATKIMDERYIDTLQQYGIEWLLFSDLVAQLTKLSSTGRDDVILFLHTNRALLKYITHLKRIIPRENVFYIQHLFYHPIKFKILSHLINTYVGNFIQITPRTERLVKKYIKIPVHFFPNFYIRKHSVYEYDEIRSIVRKKLGLGLREFVVTFSSFFKKGKGLEDFIQLTNDLSDYRIKFIIIGDGPERWRIMKTKKKNFLWLGLQSDVERFLIASDVFVFPSYAGEMLPMAVIEAISVGIPVVAYRNVITEYLLPEDLLAEDYDSLKRKIISLRNSDIRKWKYSKIFDLEFGIRRFQDILGSKIVNTSKD